MGIVKQLRKVCVRCGSESSALAAVCAQCKEVMPDVRVAEDEASDDHSLQPIFGDPEPVLPNLLKGLAILGAIVLYALLSHQH